jgi:hypothetical protein
MYQDAVNFLESYHGAVQVFHDFIGFYQIENFIYKRQIMGVGHDVTC